MPKITRDQVKVPADVLADVRETYVDNYMKATRGTGRLMLFACDQKVEHLNKDFYGASTSPMPSRSTSSRSAIRACAAFWLASVVLSRSMPPITPTSTTW